MLKAKKLKAILTWQEFLGRRLFVGTKTICVSGTHGKSTTTALASLVFEAAGLDPSVMVGAKVKEWNANYRVGKKDLFIVESDEFFNNFLSYSPWTIVLNNIEFDHPDFFAKEEDVLESFQKHISTLDESGSLIYNFDSPNVRKIVKRSGLSYSLVSQDADLYVKLLKREENSTVFRAVSPKFGINKIFNLNLLGDHNVSNACGVLLLALVYGIDLKVVGKVFAEFQGVGRRMEVLLADPVFVYDDYAHHPTAIKVTLAALRQRHKKEKIWAVVEPHGFSRTKKLL